MELEEIKKYIPHRFPFLFVDRITELEPGVRAVGIKNVSANEAYFEGHFPGNPVMPGVIVVEALAQVGSVMILCMPEYQGMTGYFAGINDLRFKRQVAPGDQIVLEAVLTRSKRAIGMCDCKATVNGEVVCQGELIFAIR